MCVQPDDSEDLSDSDSEGGDDYGGVDVEMLPESEPEDEMDVDVEDVPPAMAQNLVSLAHLGGSLCVHSLPRLRHCSHDESVPGSVTASARWRRLRDAPHPVQEGAGYGFENAGPFVPARIRDKDTGVLGPPVGGYVPPGGHPKRCPRRCTSDVVHTDM